MDIVEGGLTAQEMRQHIMRNPWKPGWYGKGIVTPTGSPVAWATSDDPDDFTYQHRAGLDALGISGGYASAIPFIIAPDGRVALHFPRQESERAARAIPRILALNPALVMAQNDHDEIYETDWED